MEDEAIKAVLGFLGESFVSGILLVLLVRAEKRAYDIQEKYNRTLLAIAGWRTNPDTSDVVPTDESADHNQRITKKIDHIQQ